MKIKEENKMEFMTEETLRAALELKEQEVNILLNRIDNLKGHIAELTTIAKERGQMIEALIRTIKGEVPEETKPMIIE